METITVRTLSLKLRKR